MGFGFPHLVLVLLIVLLLFGAKRVPDIMKDLAKGYKSFTDGLKSEDKNNSKTSAKIGIKRTKKRG